MTGFTTKQPNEMYLSMAQLGNGEKKRSITRHGVRIKRPVIGEPL